MKMPPLKRHYFSSDREKERFCRQLYWLIWMAMIGVLILFWEPLRRTSYTYTLVSFTLTNPAVEVFFRFFTILGSEGFFLPFLSIVYWAVNKSMGFWGLMVMPLSIFVTSEIPKDMIRLPRPDIRGVSVPTFTFPSGHTSGAVSVWGFLAVRIRKRPFWIWAMGVVLLVGLSRTMLGYHFLGDVLGGFITGMAFLAVFFWVGIPLVVGQWARRLPFPLVLAGSFFLPLFLSLIPASFAPRLMGYLAGTASGSLLEREQLGFKTGTTRGKQLLKVLLGLSVLVLIMFGGDVLVAAHTHLTAFLQAGLAGFWITYLAPRCFMRLGLS